MLQNIPKEKILEVVKQGPTFPAKIAKQLGGGGDTMLIGAILSTLISTGDIKVSTLKVGGSPLYYVPEQESKLEDFLSYMNEKDKRVFILLKAQKVLQDSAQDPLTRVSLRTIKDFAKSFEIDYQGQKVLFWRFYSLSKEDAVPIAKKVVIEAKQVETETPVVKEAMVKEPVQKSEHKPSLIMDPKPVVIETPIATQIETTRVHAEEKHVHTEKKHVEHVDIVQQVLEDKVPQNVSSEKIHEKHEHHEKSEKAEHHEHAEKEQDGKEHEKHKTNAAKVPKTPKVPKVEYDFFEVILNHVASKRLDVISKEKIKKTEYDLILKNHENNEYIYCKAKDKDTISEGDLAPALIFAQNKKMPCLFLSTGTLSQRAESMIHKEFSGLTFEHMTVSQ